MHSKKVIFTVMLLTFFISDFAVAKSVTAIALFKDRAMLSIDGSKAKIIRAGKTYKKVTLISSNTSEAIIEIAGVKKTLKLNGTANVSSAFSATTSSGGSARSVTMYVDNSGFFSSRGVVNGRSIEFLVDTGANLVVFNSIHAKRLNIDYKNGAKGYASTASGRAVMYGIVLKEISVGGIKLKNIDAGVIEGAFPEVPLLGMTFLQKLDMTRSGSTMVLRKR